MVDYERMSRNWSASVLRALLAFWFVLSVGEPSVAHRCPMHGGMLIEQASPSPMAGHMGAHDGHGRHDSGTQVHHCTCIDCCVGATATALPVVELSLAPATHILVAVPALPSADVLPRPAPPHARPLATGPPRA